MHATSPWLAEDVDRARIGEHPSAGRSDDDGVAVDGHGLAESVVRLAVRGRQLGRLDPRVHRDGISRIGVVDVDGDARITSDEAGGKLVAGGISDVEAGVAAHGLALGVGQP